MERRNLEKAGEFLSLFHSLESVFYISSAVRQSFPCFFSFCSLLKTKSKIVVLKNSEKFQIEWESVWNEPPEIV